MTYYFDNPENVKRLKETLEGWIGTPFRHRACVKGLGCDCIHFVAGVFDEIGVFKFAINGVPEYPPDWHLHNTREMLLEGIKSRVPVEQVSLDNPKDGDIMLGHYGQAASHASVYLGGYLYHSLNQIGVIKEEFKNSKIRPNLKFALRILA